jgi:hypothetical protein
LLESQDVTGKWQRKRREFRPRMQARDPLYMPNPDWVSTLTFLFPEVGASIGSFLDADPVRRA